VPPSMPARGHHRAFRASIAPLRAAATPSRAGDGRTAGGTVASNRCQHFQATDDALADRFSGRQDDAHKPRSHLSGPVRPRPRSAAPRTDGLLANRAGGAGAEGAPEILTGRLGRDVENFCVTAYGEDSVEKLETVVGKPPHPRDKTTPSSRMRRCKGVSRLQKRRNVGTGSHSHCSASVPRNRNPPVQNSVNSNGTVVRKPMANLQNTLLVLRQR
jgi:hypothetical protein